MFLRYKEWDLYQNTLQTFPKQSPPKTTTLKTALIPCHSVNHKEMVLWAIVQKVNFSSGDGLTLFIHLFST